MLHIRNAFVAFVNLIFKCVALCQVHVVDSIVGGGIGVVEGRSGEVE
jgi:hypothetical protein